MAYEDSDLPARCRELAGHDDARGWRRLVPGWRRGRLLMALLPLLAILFWLATWERRPAWHPIFSPDGTLLVVTTLRRGREAMQVWDVRDSRLVWSVASPSEIHAMAFSPDGKSLAAGRADGTIDVWDLAMQTMRLQISGDETPVVWLNYSSDGKQLVSVATSGEVKVFDVARNEPATYQASAPARAAISPDGRRVAVSVWSRAGVKDNVTCYDLSSGSTANARVLPVTAYGLAFSCDGKRLALAGRGQVRIWSDETEQFVDAFDAKGINFAGVAFSQDEKFLAAVGDGGTAVWDLANGKQLWLSRALFEERYAFEVAFAPDGRTLIVGETLHRQTISQVTLYEAATGRELAVLPPQRPFTLILGGWTAAFAVWAVAWLRCGLAARGVWQALGDVAVIEGLIVAGLIIRLAATSGRFPEAATLGALTGIFSLLITWSMLGRSRWQWRAPGLIAGWALLSAVLIALCQARDFAKLAVWNVSLGATAMLAMLLFLMRLVQARGWRFVPTAEKHTVSVRRIEAARQFRLQDMLTWTFAAAIFFGTFRYVAPQDLPAVAIGFNAAVGAGVAVASATGVWAVFGHAPLVVRLAALAVVPSLCASLVEFFRSFGALDPWWWYVTFEVTASLFVAGALAAFFLHGLRLRRGESMPSNLPAVPR